MSPGVGNTHTFDECYIETNGNVLRNGSGTVARVVVTGSVLALPGGVGTGSSPFASVASDHNDIVRYTSLSVPAIASGTSDNDFIAGNRGSMGASVPWGADGPFWNWADANFFLNVDTDSGNTTSTSSPVQYSGLAANRTNALSAPNKALTISSISSGTPTSSGTTVTFTTGIRARSRLLISTTSGNTTRALAEMVSPWKYHGILDPELVDFTLPVTSHSHALVNLKASTTYYYVVECYDPCGRRFLSTEQSFATTAAAVSSGGGDGTRHTTRSHALVGAD